MQLRHLGIQGEQRGGAVGAVGDGKWGIMQNTPAVSVPMSETEPNLLAMNDIIRSCINYWLRNFGTNAEPVFEKPRHLTHKNGGVSRVEAHSINLDPADLDGVGEPGQLR